MKHLSFKVNGQSLLRLDGFKPATGSAQYLTASFEFTPDWSGTTKTAKCRVDSSIYSANINSDTCVIPWEVLAIDKAKQIFGKQCFYLWVEGINGAKTIKTGEVKIELDVQGNGEEVNASDPTPSVYAQFVAEVKAETKASADTATAQAENATASAESAAASAASLKNDYSNALKGNASGAIIRLDDVSPVEHLPVVKVHGKNLLPYPYRETKKTIDGVTFTTQADGGIALNGTPTSNFVALELYKGEPLATKGKIKISLLGEFTGIYIRYDIKNSNGNSLLAGGAATSNTINLDDYPSATEWNIFVRNVDKVGEMNGVAYPQIELGDTATEYTPYVDPSTVKVTRCGKNFWHSRGLTYPRTVSGVTIDYDEDTQVYTFNGTSTAAGDLYVCPNNTHIMTINAGETWTLKVEVVGGNIDGVATSSGKISPLVNTSNYTNTIHANAEALYATKKYTEAADITKMYFYVYASGIVFNNFKCRVQFELGNKPTEFEKSKSMAEYTPNADGIIEGITSVAPTMTLLTDTNNTVIECEYNRDINKVIADIMTQLAGG